MSREPPVTHVIAEPVTSHDADRLAHLGAHRRLIVRRALLAGAIRGFFPVPIVDDQIAGRVRAGLFGKLAAGRQVDLPPASAAVLAETRDGGVGGTLTLAAAAALVGRFAGRKFLALLAAGRGADEMAHIFYRATLFDHYCAKLHVGGPVSLDDAHSLRAAIEAELRQLPLGPPLTAFGEGSRILGRSLLEAPRWLSQRIARLAERFVRTGGNPDVLDAVIEPAGGEDTWLERAAQAVEEALARAGSEHLARIIQSFEARWRRRPGQENARAD
jgi:hypothetical protein